VSSDLRLSLSIDKPTYRSGEPIGMELRVVNEGERQQILRFASGQRHDFHIEDAEGRQVWRWSAGRGFIQMLGEERLEVGEELVYREEFQGRLEPDHYHLVATLTSVDQARSVSSQFAIER
jgi:hypothetical protein